jgi:hypothetical protein
MSTFDPAGGSATGSAGNPAHSGVDKQGADAGGGRYLALQDLDMVGQITAFEPGVGQHHDGVQNMIPLKNRHPTRTCHPRSRRNNPGATPNNRQKPWRCLFRTSRSDSRAS